MTWDFLVFTKDMIWNLVLILDLMWDSTLRDLGSLES